MNRVSFVFYGVPRSVGLAFSAAIVAALIWAAAAQAQTLSPAEDQYGDPTASLSITAESSGIPDGDGSAGDDPPTAGSSKGVLPSTGGPMLLVYAGALVVSSAGVVLLRRRSG